MSQQNVEIVRAIYDGLSTNAPISQLMAPDLEYVNPPYAVESGTHRDREAFWGVFEVYPDFRVEPERYIDAGDDVVVIGTARGTGASGVEVQWRQGYIWTIKDGIALRFRWFNDPAEALEAVGLRG